MPRNVDFEECYECVAPKRHPGCQDHCPGYAKGLARHNKRKAAENADREVRMYVQDIYAKNKAADAKRKQKQGRRKRFDYGNL